MRQVTPHTEAGSIRFASGASERPTKRRQWMLDTSTENSVELLGEYNRRQTCTTKQSRSTTVAGECSEQTRSQLYERSCMLGEDIAGRLIKRVELIAEREQIQLVVDSQQLGETHRTSMKLVECSKRTSQLKQELFEYGLLKKRLQERLQLQEMQATQHEQLLEALEEQHRQTVAQQKQKQADCEYKLLEFADRHSLLKVVMQFLLEYRSASQSRKEGIRGQFLRFQKTILSGNRVQEIQRLTDELRSNYSKISRDYSERYSTLEHAGDRVRLLREKCIGHIKQLEKELLSVKVNEEIGYSELSEAQKSQQHCQSSAEQIVNAKSQAIFTHYCDEHQSALAEIAQRYGGEFRRRLLGQARQKFHTMIQEQLLSDAHKSAGLSSRLKLLSELILSYTQIIERQLVPQLSKINSRLHRTRSTTAKQPDTVDKQNELPEEDRRDSAYEYIENDSKHYSRQLQKSVRKRSLDQKRLRMSVDCRTKQLFKLRKNSRQEERLLTDTIDVRTTESSSACQKTVVLSGASEAGQLLLIIRQLQAQTAVWKKSYAVAPTFQLQSNLEKMGYASRLISLSTELTLQFRVGRQPSYRSTNLRMSKVDQTIQLQRVRRIDKVRAGNCFTLCLDRGVLDIVFRGEEEFVGWFNGLTSLLRNRSLLGKLRHRL